MIKFKDKVIPLAAIRVSPLNWQREVSEKEIEELSTSIAELGQMHQLIVRQVKGKSASIYELLAGRRRLLSMKAEGFREARCAVVDVDDRTAELMSIAENLHRSNPKEPEVRWGLKRFAELKQPEIEKHAADEEERHKRSGTRPVGRPPSVRESVVKAAAESFGMSPSTAREAMKRDANLCPTARKALDLGRITIDQANRLARMSKGKQHDELRRMMGESQQESKTRLQEQEFKKTNSPTQVVIRNLENIKSLASSLQSKADELANYVDKRALDWDEIRKGDLDPLRGAANSLLDLAGLIETG